MEKYYLNARAKYVRVKMNLFEFITVIFSLDSTINYCLKTKNLLKS